MKTTTKVSHKSLVPRALSFGEMAAIKGGTKNTEGEIRLFPGPTSTTITVTEQPIL